jgi:hypothetical protein
MYQQGRALNLNAEYEHAFRAESHGYHRYDLEDGRTQHATLAHIASLRHQVQPRLVALAAAAMTAAFAVLNF